MWREAAETKEMRNGIRVPYKPGLNFTIMSGPDHSLDSVYVTDTVKLDKIKQAKAWTREYVLRIAASMCVCRWVGV